MSKRFARALLPTALAAAFSPLAWSTNGMNMEGYGPIASAMGGAAFAYDNGTAAMMNNPATLGLMDAGSRLDIFFGFLGPDVEAEAGGQVAESDGTAYAMPAAGWVRKHNGLTYGIGVYGQGGMGTEFDATSFLGNPSPFVTSNLENRTELSVGRVILPLAFDVHERLVIGGSLDFVWSGLDLKMAMSGAQFTDLVSTQNFGTAGDDGSGLVSTFNGFVGSGAITRVDYAYFDFSNGNDFTGQARAYGVAGKLGAVFRVNDRLSVGATYHSETRLNDMKTSGADLLFGVEMMGSAQAIPVSGDLKVRDFQWPEIYGIGAAWQASDSWFFTGDIKRIEWADTMDSFDMSFTADASQADPRAAAFAGRGMEVSLFQRWDDQVVYQLGGAYRWSPKLTLRAGVNLSDNPVPDTYLNALFPAIVRNHVTAGFGYVFNPVQSIDFSVQHAPEVSETSAAGVTSRHGQTSFQFIYSHRF
ncbi:OmpP1/FadL family transporter [Thiohalobacter thiocyanaticus]|uniref:Aromatic hydrocarbon degradation protein n=1 Tax=Thiohalobacter thiocyanaticus TaxID=585455 RepID=A0A426QHI6_9GAMM|nr:outer membrane protein transport protein [Thiohalobacter thiocyanaticus]RRQ21176.1 aromatic hydrocarbon degradation protein [Thiohalobacter thiocyanaticus]